jgi:hypothetical protein
MFNVVEMIEDEKAEDLKPEERTSSTSSDQIIKL